jgi:hypothetical protein
VTTYSCSSQSELAICDFTSPFIDFDKWTLAISQSSKKQEILICIFLHAYTE